MVFGFEPSCALPINKIDKIEMKCLSRCTCGHRIKNTRVFWAAYTISIRLRNTFPPIFFLIFPATELISMAFHLVVAVWYGMCVAAKHNECLFKQISNWFEIASKVISNQPIPRLFRSTTHICYLWDKFENVLGNWFYTDQNWNAI